MNGTFSIGWEIYLLGLIAFLLIILIFMVSKVVTLLTTFQERRGQMLLEQTIGFDPPLFSGDCTEEELAAITAALSQILPENQLNIVNLKLIQ